MSGIQRILLARNADKIADNFAAQVVASYQAAILAAGGSISALHLKATKAFVKTGFKDRWWFSLVDCCLFLGADLTSALVKIIAAPGAGTSYVNHGPLVAGDYGATTGVSVSGNTTKYIGTGVIPANQGLGLDNISLVIGCTSNADGSRLLGSDEPDGGICAIYGAPHSVLGNRANQLPWIRSYDMGYSAMPNYTCGACEGIRVVDSAVNGSTGTYVNEIQIFRTTLNNVVYIANTSQIGFFSVGEMLTVTQLQSLTAAVRRLHMDARAITVLPRYIFIGDSITVGLGTTGSAKIYAAMVAAARGAEAINNSQSGSQFLYGFPPGMDRYRGTERLPTAKFFCMMGTNDCDVSDSTTNGDPVMIAQYRAALVTMAKVLMGQGAQVIILSPPYNTIEITPKVLAWVDGALGAASDAGIIGIDTCRPMIDTGNPTQYLSDAVHMNDLGHAFVRDLILAVI